MPITKEDLISSLKDCVKTHYANKSNILSLKNEEIDKSIWDGSMNQDALRSVVKELRKKTYKELIKNISGIGYRFNLN